MRPEGCGCGKREVNDRLLFGDFDALDLFEFLDARLHLLGLGCLGAEAIEECFEVLDLLALVAIGGLELCAALVLLALIFRVIALVNREALVPDFYGAVDGDIEKIAIMRDENVTERIAVQIILKPVAGFEVEVVGGLVEEQQVGLGQQ